MKACRIDKEDVDAVKMIYTRRDGLSVVVELLKRGRCYVEIEICRVGEILICEAEGMSFCIFCSDLRTLVSPFSSGLILLYFFK